MSTLVIESIRRSCGYSTTKSMVRSAMRHIKGWWYPNDTILEDFEKYILIQEITSAIGDVNQLSTTMRKILGTGAQLICTRDPSIKKCFCGNVRENLKKILVEIDQTGKINKNTLKYLEKYIKFVYVITEQVFNSLKTNRMDIDESILLNYNNGWSFKVNFIC